MNKAIQSKSKRNILLLVSVYVCPPFYSLTFVNCSIRCIHLRHDDYYVAYLFILNQLVFVPVHSFAIFQVYLLSEMPHDFVMIVMSCTTSAIDGKINGVKILKYMFNLRFHSFGITFEYFLLFSHFFDDNMVMIISIVAKTVEIKKIVTCHKLHST